MNAQSNLIESDILAYLKQHEEKDLLRFLTCGSVDDGKSTLIGRLLHDSKMIFEDQLAAIEKDSKKVGTQGDEVDLALLVDGLQSEREQGITIDVAYRYFSTEKRKFIIADTPGHEQYTRNMATGASTCDLAIILVDAREGVKTQTRRHSYIVSLLGIKQVIVAVNKMDLVDYDESRFEQIRQDYLEFSQSLGLEKIHFIPLSALKGDNVVNTSPAMSWYKGAPLIELLDTVDITLGSEQMSFRFPVQYVNRPSSDFRGFSGTIAAGRVKPGDTVTTLPSGKSSKVKSIVTFDGELSQAEQGDAITITLEDEIDISRGDMIYSGEAPLVADGFDATLVWMNEASLQPGKEYEFKFANRYVTGCVNQLHHNIDVNTLAHTQATELALNEIALVQVHLNQEIAFELYQNNPQTGAFVIVDKLSNVTVGAGMIHRLAEIDTQTTGEVNWAEFEKDLNQLVRKHFPHWQAKDITQLFKS